MFAECDVEEEEESEAEPFGRGVKRREKEKDKLRYREGRMVSVGIQTEDFACQADFPMRLTAIALKPHRDISKEELKEKMERGRKRRRWADNAFHDSSVILGIETRSMKRIRKNKERRGPPYYLKKH